MLLQKPNNSPPLLSPLGDDRLGTDCLNPKLTTPNKKKPLQGGLLDCFDINLTSVHNFLAVFR